MKMERKERLYPISEKQFNEAALPIILASCRGKERPPKVSHYLMFHTIVYVLRTGCPWHGVPKEYGYWRVIYDRLTGGVNGDCEQKFFWSRERRVG
jgi:transposase